MDVCEPNTTGKSYGQHVSMDLHEYVARLGRSSPSFTRRTTGAPTASVRPDFQTLSQERCQPKARLSAEVSSDNDNATASGATILQYGDTNTRPFGWLWTRNTRTIADRGRGRKNPPRPAVSRHPHVQLSGSRGIRDAKPGDRAFLFATPARRGLDVEVYAGKSSCMRQ